ncbi:MAG TPA: hypothetical protein VLM79_18660 [Kofleriaceae bacterium]|nr:hypothetical protein [Kofleriaceae bacterium]
MQPVTRLGITLGDPAGIGPEIVAATLAAAPEAWRSRLVVYGDRAPRSSGSRSPNTRMRDRHAAGAATSVAATISGPMPAGSPRVIPIVVALCTR